MFFIDVTFGALLLGAFCAAALSGAVIIQAFLYIRLFPGDSARVKAIVGAVWILDMSHSILIYASLWIYLIQNYGDETKIDVIPIPLALTVITTAILTFIVHCFFSYRIHKLSRQGWRFSSFLFVLAFFRLCCAAVTTTEMIHMKTFTAFKRGFAWVFTLGLGLSCLVDILITGCLTYSLQMLQSDKKATSLDHVISSVVLYTFETNLLTSAATTVSMVCWLTMPDNLIFMGLHFFISKLYANSLLATLNTRKQLRRQGTATSRYAGFSGLTSMQKKSSGILPSSMPLSPTRLEITVEKTIELMEHPPTPPESAKEIQMATIVRAAS